MKNELDYFCIEEAFGGNQDWFTDHWMHLGGCAAITACDSCIALEKSGLKENLYPFDIRRLCKEDYLAFGMKMKPYLRPRWRGIDRLDIYVDGMMRYLHDIGNRDLHLEPFESDRPSHEAMQLVKGQIDKGFPIPFLLLKHDDARFRDLLWHWFMLVGYDENGDTPLVKIATYGKSYFLPFNELWNSGYHNNGGMILFS
ncbi:MAG: hypothetical protein Q4C22_02010 [Bacillota bacterium]|nr:hypothetical protein [Bacillota bacterium]